MTAKPSTSSCMADKQYNSLSFGKYFPMITSQNRFVRGMIISLFIIGLSAFNFINIEGHADFRAIHIVTLLVCGMGIGILLVNFIGWLRFKKK